ncbi:unnamed protein product [Allacma fusca]|uniref:Uncharacterized protein n=1 Tax=Allacma fusca TaxID=39272 RepID=A0A8J2K6S8_9HEXA|nr:unnamed protein product [Allacma fusca]
MLTLYLLAQQHTLGALLTIKNRIFAAAALVAFHSLTIALSSGTVRSLRALPDWLYYITYVTQTRYAGAFLNQVNFQQFSGNRSAPIWNGERELSCSNSDFGRGCRYMSGKHYLHERYYQEGDRDDLNYWLNYGICFGFPVVAFLINLMVYTMPLPLLVKNKFRE